MENQEPEGDPEVYLREDIRDMGLPTVIVESEMFTAEAVAFFAMPGMKVFEVMMSGEDERGARIFELFKLSVHDAQKVEELSVLTFQELQMLLAQWMMRSNMLQHGIEGTTEGEQFDE